ncbi:MAG: hypothetical protein FWE47_01425 [Oscillospiraceae bacterium]|nr:hypothetical protein [Oscillospiraceae bacterium]
MDLDKKEIVELIKLGYQWHFWDGKGDRYEGLDYVPFYNDRGPYSQIRTAKGATFGFCGFTNHSQSTPWTWLGVVMGEHLADGFKFKDGIFFDIQDDTPDRLDLRAYLLKPKEGGPEYPIYDRNNRAPELIGARGRIYDWKSKTYIETGERDWDMLSEDEQVSVFLNAMETVGYKRDDVSQVLQGKMTAAEAYMAVAPKEINNRRIVFFGNKRNAEFRGNNLVWARYNDFSNIELDKFPFPFDGPLTIDCEKFNTQRINFGMNARRHKLINVNSNNRSIYDANIRNAIIDEPIDLSKLDAYGTKFGHHTVINLDKYPYELKYLDLTLAIDENGDRFNVNEYGRVQLDSDNQPEIVKNSIRNFNNAISVCASAYNAKSVQSAFDNGADGIGLIRTEDMFGKELLRDLFTKDEYGICSETLKKLGEIQRNEAREIFKIANGRRVVFRLMDVRLEELVSDERRRDLEWNKGVPNGGASQLRNCMCLTNMQASAIFDAAIETGASVDILVPRIEWDKDFDQITMHINTIASSKGFKNYRVGAMIENVRAANDAHNLAKIADFISFGTNDLTQSVTGLPRNSDSEAFIRLTPEAKAFIKEGIYRAKISKPNIEIGFCGDHSSYAENLEFYRELGANYISCNSDFASIAKEFINDSEKMHSSQNVTHRIL